MDKMRDVWPVWYFFFFSLLDLMFLSMFKMNICASYCEGGVQENHGTRSPGNHKTGPGREVEMLAAHSAFAFDSGADFTKQKTALEMKSNRNKMGQIIRHSLDSLDLQITTQFWT